MNLRFLFHVTWAILCLWSDECNDSLLSEQRLSSVIANIKIHTKRTTDRKWNRTHQSVSVEHSLDAGCVDCRTNSSEQKKQQNRQKSKKNLLQTFECSVHAHTNPSSREQQNNIQQQRVAACANEWLQLVAECWTVRTRSSNFGRNNRFSCVHHDSRFYLFIYSIVAVWLSVLHHFTSLPTPSMIAISCCFRSSSVASEFVTSEINWTK